MQMLTFLDLAKNELRQAKIGNVGSDPTPAAGDIGLLWFNTGSSKLKVWDGTAAHILNIIDSVSATAPVTAAISGAGVLSISVAAASGASSGLLSAANYTTLNGATSSNTPSTLVLRDGSGNFAAGTITAALTGTASNAAQLNNQADTFYLARANHTGTQLAATISNFDTQVRTSRLDQMAAPTAAVSLNSQRITGLADPTSATDAATKQYVDATAAGFEVKASVRVASTANITVASALINGATIDGITVATGDRVLLKNQTTPAENGIWIVAAAGAASRSTDANGNSGAGSNGVNAGMFVFVEQGTANGATAWVLTTQGAITLGTTGLSFSQVGATSAYTAGNGLTLGGNSFSVVGTTNRISVSGSGVDISASYVGQSSITTLGTITTGVWTGTAIAVLNGGTGATTAAGARANLGATASSVTTITGNGALTSFTQTHNLANINHVVSVYDSSNNLVQVDVVRGANADTVTVTPALANGTTLSYVVVG